MNVFGLKLRWINTQCYQIVLPNGAVILTDPTIRPPREDKPQHAKLKVPNFTIEDLDRVDYIIVSHTHFDHIPDIGSVFEMYHPLVIAHHGCAKEIGEFFNIPFTYIYPVEFDGTYVLDDFTLQTHHGRHNPRVTRRPSDSVDAARDIYDNLEGDTFPLSKLGDLYNINFSITTHENYRIGFGAGVDDAHLKKVWQDAGLNILLRFVTGVTKNTDFDKVVDLAVDWMKVSGAQLMLPMHHESMFHNNPADVDKYVSLVNEKMASDGCQGRMFNPRRCEWVQIGLAIDFA